MTADNLQLLTDIPNKVVSSGIMEDLRCMIKQKVTFMRAFESSPVHWEKSRPSGKRRRPGKGGTAEILGRLGVNNWFKWSKSQYLRWAHRWSISSIMASAAVVPCTCLRYSPIHSTRWSLNVPLISWWSKSGAISSWMSARGKECVNGCKESYVRFSFTPVPIYWVEHTTISSRIPYSSQSISGSKCLMRKSVFSCVRQWLCGSSRLLDFASHLRRC